MKTYSFLGKQYTFDYDMFHWAIEEYRTAQGGMKIGEIEKNIGAAVFVTPETVHSWRMRKNQPSNIETVDKIGMSLGLNDTKMLLKEVTSENKVDIDSRQRESLKRVYDAVLEFLDRFIRTEGFTDYWEAIIVGKNKGPQAGVYSSFDNKSIAEKELHKVQLTLKKERFVLNNLPVYIELQLYVYDDLPSTYEDKLSKAIRHNGISEIEKTKCIPAKDDYLVALQEINRIMEPYMG